MKMINNDIEIDWDYILEITKKNAIQMIKDYKKNKHIKYDYKFKIKPTEHEIKITIKKTGYDEIQVTLDYIENNKDIDEEYKIPKLYNWIIYTHDWPVENLAEDFINDIKVDMGFSSLVDPDYELKFSSDLERCELVPINYTWLNK